MQFTTTKDQEALRTKIRTWAEETVKPQAFLLDQGNVFPK